MLSAWPLPVPADWLDLVNTPTPAEAQVRECLRRGRPPGDEAWRQWAAERLGLEATLRPRGRPPRRRSAPAVSS